jgi:hypothetical protein
VSKIPEMEAAKSLHFFHSYLQDCQYSHKYQYVSDALTNTVAGNTECPEESVENNVRILMFCILIRHTV